MTHDLDELFAAARAAPLRAPEGLVARVLHDADREMPRQDVPVRVSLVHVAPEKPGFWARLSGGFALFAGMATAAVAGLWIGFAQPIATGLMVGVLDADLGAIDMMPGIDALLDEDQ